jgi:hypothetical protein
MDNDTSKKGFVNFSKNPAQKPIVRDSFSLVSIDINETGSAFFEPINIEVKQNLVDVKNTPFFKN